jgi:thiamine pyrophosphate-dependent acetolactate synthase large subunit-like protein
MPSRNRYWDFDSVTKWNYQITEASEIEIMAKAFYIARSGRPGPVLVDITKNAQFDEFSYIKNAQQLEAMFQNQF